MKNNICPECRTENEPQYIYCKNCGTKISNNEGQFAEGNIQNEQKNGGFDYKENHGIIDIIDGNPSEDVGIFVGKKSINILPKFSKMELTSSKASWCWPAAILGYLFGPFGTAIWMFYRKMYKLALIFMTIGVAVTVVSTASVGGSYDELLAPLEDVEIYTFNDFVQLLDGFEITPKMMISSALSEMINIASFVVSGLFGMYWYKRFTAQKIHRYRASDIDHRYYRMGLASIGGTSAGMAILAVIIMNFCEEIISTLFMIFM